MRSSHLGHECKVMAALGYEYSGATLTTHGIVGLAQQKPDNSEIHIETRTISEVRELSPDGTQPVFAIGASTSCSHLQAGWREWGGAPDPTVET